MKCTRDYDGDMPTAAKVLFPLPLPPFSYLVPFDRAEPVPGCRVVVPWQSGVRLGLVQTLETIPAAKALELRELIDTLELTPFIPATRLPFLSALAERSCARVGRVLASLLPAGLTETLQHEVQAVAGTNLEDVPEDSWRDAASVNAKRLDLYRRQGLIRERVRKLEPTVRVLRGVRPPDKALAGKPQAKQREALSALLEYGSAPSAAAFARDAGVSESALRALVKKGYAHYAEVSAPPPPLPHYSPVELPAAAAQLPDAPRLLVSGGVRSARLAALFPLLRRDLARGRSVLILVPEGVLVEETAAYVSAQLPTHVLSGALSDAQRQRLWRELASGPVVLVGSYLALLAPLEPLGRIIVLEEGSPSYKLQSGPRLFVPSAARLLADTLDVPLVLTDALPTPEALHHTPPDAHVALPYPEQRLHVTDLVEDRNWPLSADLVRVLKQVDARRRQAIIIAPRRGFSAALGCAECGFVAMCPNCDLPLRYHRQRRSLKCHQCAYHSAPPPLCPECRSGSTGPMRAAGTEWLLSEVRKHIGSPLYHYDADLRNDLSPLLAGEPGVVVATTAILRHPPLPGVSLIAVALLDSLLSVSDFRAEEEALRLILNFTELQPERRPLTLIQTFQREHPLVGALQGVRDEAIPTYLQGVLERRRHYSYPPFVDMAKIQVSARDEAEAQREATWLADAIRLRLAEGDEVLGPSPAPVVRLRRMFSYQLFVRTARLAALPDLLEPVGAYAGRARVRVDVDPRDIGAYLD